MNNVAKIEKAVFWTAIAFTLLLALLPELAHAQSGGNIVKGKIDDARTNWVLPIGIGILGVGGTVSVLLWAFKVVEWTDMARWVFAGAIVGVIVTAIGMYV
ncbi:hypothetical protein J3A72_000435 [Stenotrophomonas sp. PvP093]|jgi:hypothetical protein|uniref:hypothetical protein n=1 Tax=unclassified Stenotrophomonas TaxID=196198 RepID=UPI001AE23793|nr:hypothetical protein [Stenotrophomonas sp. PvP093]MBP2480143.1 hypothetical protein [Stenotrophomonas sp. PvP093]